MGKTSEKDAVVYPTGFEHIPATSLTQLESILKELDGKKAGWATTNCKARAKLLRASLDTCTKVVSEAAAVAVQAKGSYGAGSADEMLSWTPILSGLREFAEAMDANGQPKPKKVTTRPDGQVVVTLAPYHKLEEVVFPGLEGQLWIEPGKEATQGALYKAKAAGEASTGGVALVLGAGNQVSVVGLDILHMLMLEDNVVVCKMNPVNEYLGPFLRKAFAPLVAAGFVEFVYGGAKEGEFLCKHPLVTSVHLTGSAQTFDAIVWGGKPKDGEPALKKRVTAELGCVTPYIITPGKWSDYEIERNAEEVASVLANNCGHNCLKVEVVVTDAEWPQRDQYLASLRAKLEKLPRQAPYYPGSASRISGFQERFPDAEKLGTLPEGAPETAQPFLLKSGLTPETACTTVENWVSVLQEIALPGCGGDPKKFLPAAVTFANEKCWGTLSACIFIHPEVEKSCPAEVDAAIAGLRYGSVCVNFPTFIGFTMTRLTWGGFPGHTIQDIVSGNCSVHNTMFFDHPQKGVVRAPFKMGPKPNLARLAPPLVTFTAYPTILNLFRVIYAALRG